MLWKSKSNLCLFVGFAHSPSFLDRFLCDTWTPEPFSSAFLQEEGVQVGRFIPSHLSHIYSREAHVSHLLYDTPHKRNLNYSTHLYLFSCSPSTLSFSSCTTFFFPLSAASFVHGVPLYALQIGSSALIEASRGGHAATVTFLLKIGADKDAEDMVRSREWED